MNARRIAVPALLALGLAAAVVLAQDIQLPANVIRAQQQLVLQAQQISFLVAFLAGFLSFVSPCTWPALAPFFAFGFKEKRRITRMTLVFFAGFTLVFIALGLLASVFAGFFDQFRSELALAAGLLLVLLGAYTFFGKGFALVRINHTFRNDHLGVFLMGTAFAVGFTPCVGPILAGVLILASTLAKLKAALLMVAYALGIFAPLLLLAVAWDRMGWFRALAGTEVSLFGKPRNIAHVIAGVLLVAAGLVFIFLRDTSFANSWDPLGVKTWWFIVQDYLIGSPVALAAAAAALALVALLVAWHLRTERLKKGV